MNSGRGKKLVSLALASKETPASEISESQFEEQENDVSSSTKTYNFRRNKQKNYYAKYSDSSECPSDFSVASLSDGVDTICSDSVGSESYESDVFSLRELGMDVSKKCADGSTTTEIEGPMETEEDFFHSDNVKIMALQLPNSEIESQHGTNALIAETGSILLNANHDDEYHLISAEKTEETDTTPNKDMKNTSVYKNVDRVIANFGKIVSEPIDSIEHCTSTRPWTKKAACLYCFQEVTHFPRHLKRNHKDEGAVKELLAMSLKDPKRKDILNVIRRQGNYQCNEQSNVLRPVRRPKAFYDKPTQQTSIENLEKGKEIYVACPDCLGFFKRSFLRRHRKTCRLRPKNKEFSKRENHLTAAQMFKICGGAYKEFYDSLRLKDEVFKIMRADERSKVAMNDILICSYADSLLGRHKRIQIRTTVSNKMRELARLLITLREKTAVQRFFDILKPEFFDNIVSATKIISGYNPETRTYKASSLALHMGTTLKQVCDIATKMIIKKSQFLPCNDPEQSLKSIKRIRSLISNHWNAEVSSLALKDLNEKQWEKPKLFPLTRDLIHFQQYVMKEAKEACENIMKEKQMTKEYRRLAENVLALTLLLNRKRIGEIQYLKVKTYNADVSVNQQEEFFQSLSETEKVLTKSFKRVMTGGKGSKPVPILFPKNTQKYIGVMLNVRPKYVPHTNEYLFANPETADRWLSGYHVLKKLASESGVENQHLFTSTRLRKQIATVLQVMNITDTEMEQFAAFMAHTKKTHETYYRLPQDVYQTAKVSKLLLAINKGNGALYKGKTLDEIEFSDNVDTDESDSGPDLNSTQRVSQRKDARDYLEKDAACASCVNIANICNLPGTSGDTPLNNDDENNTCLQDMCPEDEYSPSTVPDTATAREKKKPRIKRVRWTEEQKRVMTMFFKDHIKSKTAPKKHEVEVLIGQHKRLFKDKNWIIIKAFVYNSYRNR